MKRSQFLQLTGIISMGAAMYKVSSLKAMAESLPNTPLMPVLFLGHGSPMNAIEENEFVQGFRKIGKEVRKPSAILCVSAHWETKGTFVTAMEHPQTIHDFGGFPKALFDVQYPAPGSLDLAKETQKLIHTTEVGLNYDWGLDHGAWTVLKHLYPQADIPIVQLSIDYTKPASWHAELAKELKALRTKGVLIVGSGNMVHNLGLVAWDKLNDHDYAYDWASEASSKMKAFIHKRDLNSLIQYQQQGKSFQLAIPTPEHYLPLIYCLALQEKNEEAILFNDKAVAGSLTMTSVKIGV